MAIGLIGIAAIEFDWYTECDWSNPLDCRNRKSNYATLSFERLPI